MIDSTRIKAYHAHIYYDAISRPRAAALRDERGIGVIANGRKPAACDRSCGDQAEMRHSGETDPWRAQRASPAATRPIRPRL